MKILLFSLCFFTTALSFAVESKIKLSNLPVASMDLKVSEYHPGERALEKDSNEFIKDLVQAREETLSKLKSHIINDLKRTPNAGKCEKSLYDDKVFDYLETCKMSFY